MTALGIYLHLSGQYELFVGVYWFSSFLDLIDGYAARKLGQMSRFGEVSPRGRTRHRFGRCDTLTGTAPGMCVVWRPTCCWRQVLDVVVDNIGRAFLWSYVAGSQPGHVAAPLAVGVTVLEFLTFASTHASYAAPLPLLLQWHSPCSHNSHICMLATDPDPFSPAQTGSRGTRQVQTSCCAGCLRTTFAILSAFQPYLARSIIPCTCTAGFTHRSSMPRSRSMIHGWNR